MKKILTTILAGTLVAGAAFAADAKITVGARTFLDAFSLMNTEDGNEKSSTRNWMDWDGYRGKGKATDDLSITMSGDTFGSKLALTLPIGKDVNTDRKGGDIQVKQLSGWMKFNLGPGTLQLDGGILNEFVQGSFRANKDGGIKEGLDFETFKLGSIFADTKGMKYVDDLAFQSGKKNVGGFASYGLDVAEGVNLKVTVGGMQRNFDEVNDDEDENDTVKTTWGSAFASNVLLKIKGIADVKFVYKLDHATATENNKSKAKGSLYHTFGLYAMPQILDALTLSVGGAAEVYGGDHGKDDTDYFDWGVDLRMRYQVMDPLSITFFTNVSGTNLDDGRKLAQGIVGAKATGYKSTSEQFKVAMWNHLTGQYKINDLLTASVDVGLITPLSNAKDNKNSYGPEWRVTPSIQIFPNPESGTSLWVGVAISGMSWTVKADGKADVDHSRFGVDVPVIFRVKF